MGHGKSESEQLDCIEIGIDDEDPIACVPDELPDKTRRLVDFVVEPTLVG
jgi:hypothetical protein